MFPLMKVWNLIIDDELVLHCSEREGLVSGCDYERRRLSAARRISCHFMALGVL